MWSGGSWGPGRAVPLPMPCHAHALWQEGMELQRRSEEQPRGHCRAVVERPSLKLDPSPQTLMRKVEVCSTFM